MMDAATVTPDAPPSVQVVYHCPLTVTEISQVAKNTGHVPFWSRDWLGFQMPVEQWNDLDGPRTITLTVAAGELEGDDA